MTIDEVLEGLEPLYPNLTYRTLATNRYYYKCTYKELYEDLIQRYNLIEQAKDMFVEIRPCEISKLDEFKDKHYSSAYFFIESVYKPRDSIPSKALIKRIKKVFEELGIEYEKL